MTGPAPAATHPPRQPSVAVALGGGGARGMAHIHAIEALDELGIRPVAVAGSSIGAIMGAGLCAGIPARAIRAHVTNTFGNPAELAARVWKLRPAMMGGMSRTGFRFGQMDVARIIAAFLMPLPERFEDLSVPLTVTAVDYYAHKEVHLTSGDLASALAASAAIPGVFRPVRRDGRILIDGGIYNPCPFDLIAGKADITVAIDVVGGPVGSDLREPSTIDCIVGANQLMMRSLVEEKRRIRAPTIYLRPQASPVRALDFHRAGEVIDATAHLKHELIGALLRHGVVPPAVTAAERQGTDVEAALPSP